MSLELAAKRIRKGTRSCTECRRRKVRCIWPSPSAEICKFCQARDLVCEQQIAQTPAADAIRVTTRARLAHLERNVSGIWSALRAIEQKTGCKVSHTQALQQQAESTAQDGPESCDDSDSDASGNSSTRTAPTHLLQLFDNSLLGSRHESSIGQRRLFRQSTSPHDVHDSQALLALMPSREQMVIITAQASSWLLLYASLFPTVDVIGSGEEMLARYDELQHTDADPVAIAALLLSVALTVQQAPVAISDQAGMSSDDTGPFIRDVSDVVERTVVSDDARAGSVAGIKTAMLFLRLQLGRAKVTKVWLLVRRIIALAELVGLPRAATTLMSLQSSGQASELPARLTQLRQKAEVWESVCAIDRVISMMWSLPLGTANSALPKRPVLDAHGGVIVQSFLYHLAEIASRVQELESSFSLDKSHQTMSDMVMRADHELRALGSLPQRIWWTIGSSQPIVDGLMQYWYQYITIRAHLQLALAYDEANPHLAASFVACLAAAQELTRRYVSIRPVVPAGFFANWVLDLQAFTGAVFLLLAGHRADRSSGTFVQALTLQDTTTLLDEVIRTMASTAGQTGHTFAHQASKAIRSLDSLLRHPQASEARDISLNLPLVGKIRVSRKPYVASHVTRQSATDQSQALHGSAIQPGRMPFESATDPPDSLFCLMEFPESYSFLNDDVFADEQWLTWTE